jgi:hypothetical protein
MRAVDVHRFLLILFAIGGRLPEAVALLLPVLEALQRLFAASLADRELKSQRLSQGSVWRVLIGAVATIIGRENVARLTATQRMTLRGQEIASMLPKLMVAGLPRIRRCEATRRHRPERQLLNIAVDFPAESCSQTTKLLVIMFVDPRSAEGHPDNCADVTGA